MIRYRPVHLAEQRKQGMRNFLQGIQKLRLGNSSALRNKSSFSQTSHFLPRTKTTQSKNFRSFHQSSKRSGDIERKAKSTQNGGILQSEEIIFANLGLTLMGCAYLNQDMLYLRLSAMGSIAMSMIHQYKAKKPNLLRWNALFMCINIACVAVQRFREDLSEDLKDLYKTFSSRGPTMEKHDFKSLFDLARKEVYKEGDYIVNEGLPCKEMYFIESGSVAIVRNRSVLGQLHHGDFIMGPKMDWYSAGSMQQETLENSVETKMHSEPPSMYDNFDIESNGSRSEELVADTSFEQKEAATDESLLDAVDDKRHLNTESVLVNSGEVTVWVWDYDSLKLLDRRIHNAVLAKMSIYFAQQLKDAWGIKEQDDRKMEEMQSIAVKYLIDGLVDDKSNKR